IRHSGEHQTSSRKRMARVTGLEPATSGVTGRHSNQLSYTRAFRQGQALAGAASTASVERLTKRIVFGCQAGLRTKGCLASHCFALPPFINNFPKKIKKTS